MPKSVRLEYAPSSDPLCNSFGVGGKGVTHKHRYRCRANMAHVRQSRPGTGLDFQVEVLKTFEGVPSSPGSGQP